MKCFLNALRGAAKTVKTERNMRIHLCFAFYVLLAGFVTGISSIQWIAVLLCIALVIALECINTAIEQLCDTVHPERHPGIRFAKDAAAGAVLWAAAISAVIGCIVFLNAENIGAAYAFLKARPIASAVIILTIIPAAFFARGSIKGEHK